MGVAPDLEARVGAVLETCAKWLALAGGLLLAALALLTVASVLGRAFIFAGLGPIKGDYELVEMGCAVAVFSFLPWCQLNRGHVTVDILVDTFPARTKLMLTLVGNVALAGAASLIAWRLWLGMGEKFSYGEETYELGLPLGWGMALSCVGAILFAIIALYTIWRSVNELAAGAERGDHAPEDV